MGLFARVGCLAGVLVCCVGQANAARAVWRMTNARGQTLYISGSIHALRSVDYPLPPEFNRAFEASSRLAFEVDQNALMRSSRDLFKLGKYPAGDSLNNHVDPRTYDYLRRLFGLMKVPEKEFATYRPWLLSLILESPTVAGLSENLGVEEFLMRRANANKKPTVGLETASEHAAVFSGESDKQAEATLLLTFIPQAEGISGLDLVKAWRRGDVETLW